MLHLELLTFLFILSILAGESWSLSVVIIWVFYLGTIASQALALWLSVT